MVYWLIDRLMKSQHVIFCDFYTTFSDMYMWEVSTHFIQVPRPTRRICYGRTLPNLPIWVQDPTRGTGNGKSTLASAVVWDKFPFCHQTCSFSLVKGRDKKKHTRCFILLKLSYFESLTCFYPSLLLLIFPLLFVFCTLSFLPPLLLASSTHPPPPILTDSLCSSLFLCFRPSGCKN